MKTQLIVVALGALAAGAVLSLAPARDAVASAPPGRYDTTKLTGTVLDTKTGLYWEQTATSNKAFDWSGANDHCNALSLAGKTWRLPSMRELETIVDESVVNPSIDTTVFYGTVGAGYWTISPSRVVYFSDGWAENVGGGLFYARCVAN